MTWRSALLLLVPFAVLAAGSDAALFWSVSNHYTQHGHLGARLDLSLMAMGFTALTIFGGVAFWRELRKAPKRANAGSSRPPKRRE